MTTWDRQDKPLATEFKNFAKVVGKLDLTGVRLSPAEMAIVIPDEWAKPRGDFSRLGLVKSEATPYASISDSDAVPGQPQPNVSADNQWLISSALNAFVLGHRAGMKSDFPREDDDWSKYPMLFMPSPLTSTVSNIVHVHSNFYEKARKYVEGGGFLYASVAADAAIPDMETIFGARMVDTVTVSEVTLKVLEPFGGLKPGDSFHYSVPAANPRAWGSLLGIKGGKIIAVDQDGRPALVANAVGSGKTLLSAYPIETYLAHLPSAFEKPENTHRIYAAFRDWTGVQPAFRSDQPSVEVTSLRGDDRGYAIMANHSAEPYNVTISTSLPIKSVSLIGFENPKPLRIDGSKWEMNMTPYQAAIAEWK